MPVKVKRGLGLLVVAAIGFLLLLVMVRVPAEGVVAQVLVTVGLLVGGISFLGGLLGGLGLTAWGLLRD